MFKVEGELRLRAQELSETCSGHHSPMKWLISQFVPDHSFLSSCALCHTLAPVCFCVLHWRFLRNIEETVIMACFALGCPRGPLHRGLDMKMINIVLLEFPSLSIYLINHCQRKFNDPVPRCSCKNIQLWLFCRTFLFLIFRQVFNFKKYAFGTHELGSYCALTGKRTR